MNRSVEPEADPDGSETPISTRATPPRPRRLSRKAIIALATSGSCLIAAALTYSLGAGTKPAFPQQRVSVERRQADLLASAPQGDYEDVALAAAGGIGPPPSAAALAEMAVANEPTAASGSRTDPAEDRRRAQAETARSSRLFADAGQQRGSPANARPDLAATASPPLPANDPTKTPDNRQSAFLTGPSEPTVNSGRLQPTAGRHVISAGSTIAAALITGLTSDLPGQVVAQVTEDVFDSVTGQIRLIPQGARLLGSYDAQIGYGQTRALVVWTRLILPDGRSIDLDRLVGTDGAGRSGLTDRVDNHWGSMLKAGLLSTLLGIGAAVSELGEDGQIANAIRDSSGQTIGRAGDRIVEKQLGVQPTITVRPGARVRVLVSRDLVMEPWPADGRIP
jgi:type IV secretion system protein VirB10